MQISHRERVQRVELKHNASHDFDDDLMELIEEAVKEKADQREANQGASDGRTTEN